jgi:hypothetical protein
VTFYKNRAYANVANGVLLKFSMKVLKIEIRYLNSIVLGFLTALIPSSPQSSVFSYTYRMLLRVFSSVTVSLSVSGTAGCQKTFKSRTMFPMWMSFPFKKHIEIFYEL